MSLSPTRPTQINGNRGPRSERFPKLPSLHETCAKVGPGSYDIDKVTTLSRVLAQKPSSKLGVCLTTAQRFPDMKDVAPGPDRYDPLTFVEILDSRVTSTREVLSSLEDKSGLDLMLRTGLPVPGPGTYDINNAIGRHVGNDHKFGLVKSDRLRWRDHMNKEQVSELKKLLNGNNLFTDKRACRRMAHLTLYFPS